MSSNSSENIMDELSIILMDIDKTDKLTDNKIKTILNNLNKIEQKNKKSKRKNVKIKNNKSKKQ